MPRKHLAALLATLALAPAAAAAQPDQPETTAPPSVIEDPAPAWSFSIFGTQRFTFDADLEDDGSVSIARTGLGITASRDLTENTRLRLSLDGEYSSYDFDSAAGLAPDTDDPFDDGLILTFSPAWTYIHSEEWSFTFGGRIQYAGETDADFGDSILGGGLAFARYAFNPDFAISFGAGVASRFEDDPRFIPLIGFDWRVNERVRVLTEGLGVGVDADFVEDWTIGARLRWEPREYRLSDDHEISEGVMRDERVILAGHLAWRPTRAVEASLGLGAVMHQEFEFLDDDGDRVSKTETDPALFLSLGVTLRF